MRDLVPLNLELGRFGKHEIFDVCVDVDVAVTLQGVSLLNLF